MLRYNVLWVVPPPFFKKKNFNCFFSFVWFFWFFFCFLCFLLGSLDFDSPTQQFALLGMYKAKYVLKRYDWDINAGCTI